VRTTAKLAIAGVACLMMLGGSVVWIHVGSTRPATVSPSEANTLADTPSRLATPGTRAGTVATIRRGVPVAAETSTTASDPISTTGRLHVHVIASADERPLANVVLWVGHRVIDHPAERIETGREEE
jgi:hypothetical protein